ncbi:MAG: carboxypeptidase-like regulatory domain-containing protein [Bacteroidota bacterium]
MKKFLIFGMMLCMFFACRKDIEETKIIEETPDPPAVYVTATLLGTVVDENNSPVANATVQYGNDVYTTNEEGLFLIPESRF